MVPISGVNTSAAQPLTAAEQALAASRSQKAQEAQGRSPKPVMDEYVPEQPQEPSGLYWMGKDEDGQPKIYFDDPERPEDAPDAQTPEKPDGEETVICNTDQVDREIEQLKKKQQELTQRLHTETDEAKIKDLERQLAQVERELKQKDNDTYRKQHATFTTRS